MGGAGVPTRDGGGGNTVVLSPPFVSLRVEPAMAELVAPDGERPSQTFRAIGAYADGSEADATRAEFSLDVAAIGDIDDATGEFVANGAIGGSATVTARVSTPGAKLSATAVLSVTLERSVLGDNVPDDVAAQFEAATSVDDPSRSAQVVYPLDGVVMPQNVYPADIQWTVGATGDLYRIRFSKPHTAFTAFAAYAPDNHWLADATVWRALAQSDPDELAQLSVDRLEATTGELVTGEPIGMRFAKAALTGTVYYWDIEAGRIRRIDDGSGEAVSFMPSPPVAMNGTTQCVGCHSVSRSGRYMAGRLGTGDNIGAVFDLTSDLSPNPAPTLWPTSPSSIRWWFSTWNPDDTRMAVTFDEVMGIRDLRIYDPMTGMRVDVTGDMPTSATHPDWSPDGTRIAYVSGANNSGDKFTIGNISVLPVTGSDTFGTASVVHQGSALPDGAADSYPTWSPDSAQLAFAHGTGCRSESATAALYGMRPDGSDVVHFERAGEGGLDYQPRYSPFQQGGYYWLSFLSRRVYGNQAIGNGARPANRRQQIWVTAIRVDAEPGEDPSSVPYWLPGQNTQSANISAFWAPRPCRTQGSDCSVGSECCSGDCRPDASDAWVCSPPPPDSCRSEGETCDTSDDCCSGYGLTCTAHVCAWIPD
jgi:hypothetical protein